MTKGKSTQPRGAKSGASGAAPDNARPKGVRVPSPDASRSDPSPPAELDERMLRTILDSQPDIAIATDPALAILQVGSRAASVLGPAYPGLIGQPLSTLFPRTRRAVQTRLIKAMLARGEPSRSKAEQELLLEPASGGAVPVEVALSWLQVEGQQVAVFLFRDLTSRLGREETLRNAVREARLASQAKSDFLAAASHDIRQPLQTMRLIQAVLERRLHDADVGSLLNDLELTVSGMSEILETLLDIDQLEHGTIEPLLSDVPIRGVLRRCAREFGRQARIKGIRLRFVDSSAIVRADSRLLSQILQNIVSNALKYTPEGSVLIGCRRRGNQLRLDIWDTGIGIPEEDQPAIFDRHVARPADQSRWIRGFGIGLSIVRDLAKLMNVGLSVCSRPGRGTRFSLDLPFVGMLDRNGLSASMPTVGRPARILVVETDERELKALRTVLELEGYEVAAVSTAQNALAAAREMDWPDTIVADARLPDGMGGAELIERLRTEAARPFNAILLTVNSRPGELAQIDAAKIRHLRKPVLPKELLRVLAENLASTSWGAAPQRHATEVIHLIEPRAGEREQLSKMLGAWGVVAQPFDSAESFLATAEPSEGGCVLVDIALPGMGGLELLHEMTGAVGGPPVVVIVGHDNAMAAAQALKNGAFDILERPFQEEAVRDVVTRAVQSARASRALSNEAERHRLLFSTLTEREQEVVRHIISGAANKEIAYRLAISERTVEGHRARAMAKLDARSVQDLVRMASALGIYTV